MNTTPQKALEALDIICERLDGYQTAKDIVRDYITSSQWRPIDISAIRCALQNSADFVRTLPEDCMGYNQGEPEVGIFSYPYKEEFLYQLDDAIKLLPAPPTKEEV